MKKKTVYESEDGIEIFETEAECMAYDARQAASPKIAAWVEGIGAGNRRISEYVRVISRWEDERSVTLGEADSQRKVVNISA